MNVIPLRTIIGSIAISIAFVMELTLVPLLLPAIQSQFGLSISELAWVFNSYGIAVSFGVLLGGWLGDVFNTKNVFAVGVLFFAIGSMVVAFADGYEILITGRFLQGFGGGVFSPLVPILLTRATPNRPGKVLIIWGSVAGYVAAAAPIIYGNFLAQYGWHLAFVIFAIVSMVAMAIVQNSRTGDDTTTSDKPRPNYGILLRSHDLWLVFAYVFGTYGSITYYLFRLPLWLSDNEFKIVSIGVILSVLWLSFSVISTLLRNHVDEPNVKRILLAAPVLIAAAFLISYCCREIPYLLVSSVLIGAGLACSNAPSTLLILKFAPKGMRAASASLDITFARLGGVATVTFLAHVAFGYAVFALVLLCLLALICAWAIAKRLNTET
ncbi:MAG: MFS transporter [Marinosulfonomonas sp.]